MHVRFFLRKSRINKSTGQCPLHCRVTINGVHATPFSTSIMVAPEKWDSKLQRIKGSGTKVASDNRRLDTIRYELDELFNINRAKLILLSAKELVDTYSGKRLMGCTFRELCKKKIESLKALNRAQATIQIHERCHTLLAMHLKENLQANEIEKRHIVSFWAHLKNQGYDHDYVNKTVGNCKSLFIFGEREGYVDVNPFKSFTMTWENKLDLTRLEEWEMEALKSYEWSDNLQRVVDSFLFMCYQGLHISDYRKLAKANFITEDNIQWVSLERTKTKVEATIPLHSFAKAIIKKYGDIKNLPKLSGQRSNDYLKIIAERIGTTKHLTNKVARKTFTDMCINTYRMSDESVAAMLGHKSTKYVKKYGAVRKNRILAEWKDRIDIQQI